MGHLAADRFGVGTGLEHLLDLGRNLRLASSGRGLYQDRKEEERSMVEVLEALEALSVKRCAESMTTTSWCTAST